MAIPVGFEGANKVYRAPRGMENCGDLECFVGEHETISAWRLTEPELKQVIDTGIVWLSITGHPTQPACLSGHPLVLFNDRAPKCEPVLPKATIGGKIK